MQVYQLVLFNLIGASLLFIWISGLFGEDLSVLLLVVIVGAGLILLVWQIIGTVRAARRYLAESSDMMASLGLYSTLFIAGTFGLLHSADLAIRNPAIFTQVTIAPKTQMVLPISDDGRVITLRGPIDYPMNTAFMTARDDNPALQRVELDSKGGSIFAGRALALNIRAAGMETSVLGKCYSACTIAFVAGNTRFLASGGQLGFHGYRFDFANRVQTLDVDQEEDRDRAFFLRQGINPAFIDMIFATPPSELWLPERQILINNGVLTVN